MDFIVRRDTHYPAVLDWGAKPRACAIGRSGLGLKQKEGDGITPLGTWPLRFALYRADRIEGLESGLAVRALEQDDGWCDAPADPNYNRLVKLPYSASHEALWRRDRFYDIVVALGYNDAPVVAGKGSAIFLHVAREGYAPTEGCIALAIPDLLAVLKVATPHSTIRITN